MRLKDPHSELTKALRVLAQNRPDILLAAAGRARSGLGEMVDPNASAQQVVTAAESNPDFMDRLVSSLEKIVPTWLTYKQSEKLFDLNIQRAKQGLPPIDASSVSPTVNVGVASGTQNLIVFAILAGLAVLLLTRRR